MKNKDFLVKLQAEADKQALLNRKGLLPRQLGGVANLVANHTWKFLVVLAILTSLIIKLV